MALLIICKELNDIQPLDSPPIQTTLQSMIDPSISFPICDSIDPAALIRGGFKQSLSFANPALLNGNTNTKLGACVGLSSCSDNMKFTNAYYHNYRAGI